MYHFILLAKDEIGNQQIRELSTKAWIQSYIYKKIRRIPTYYSDLEQIIKNNQGHVIASSACLGGYLGTKLLQYKETEDEKDYQKIINWIRYIQDIFGKDNFYLELQPSNNSEQIYVNKEILKLSKLLNIPYIITTDSHYLRKEHSRIHEAFLKAQKGEREVASFYSSTYMMDTEELESYFSYFSEEELQTAYNNILKIKNECQDYSLLKPLKIPNLKWKEPKNQVIPQEYYNDIPYLKDFINSDFEGDRVLAKLIVDNIEDDLKLKQEINDNLRIVKESSEVNNVHWSSYFLNLQNIIQTCKDAGSIIGPGRGSGVGFALLYVLGITQINPTKETTKTYSWRFLNPERVSVLDVDFDVSGLRRAAILKKCREIYGEDRVANVATFGTEQSKSAIITACRGLDIDVDEALYLASMIPADRGITRTLKQCFYGDEENGFKPISEFVEAMTKTYPELWEVAQNIEGLICRTGIHAGGVIFVDEPFTNSTALMRAPDGTIVTQFDLHDDEAVSLIKYDILSVEAIDKIQTCLTLLQDYGYLPQNADIQEIYEQTVGIYNLERNDLNMWKMVWEHKIHSLFQMEQQSGIQGIALTKPKSVDDLATLNSVIRLMSQDKESESPLTKYAKFKNDINLWYKEMNDYGLTKAEQEILKPILSQSYGVCESQERFMSLVQIPECGGFDLNFADRLRKAIAKFLAH